MESDSLQHWESESDFFVRFRFCCVPRFPLILTAKFHSLYVKESAVGNFGKIRVGIRSRKFWKVELESGVGYFTSDSATLLVRTILQNGLNITGLGLMQNNAGLRV